MSAEKVFDSELKNRKLAVIFSLFCFSDAFNISTTDPKLGKFFVKMARFKKAKLKSEIRVVGRQDTKTKKEKHNEDVLNSKAKLKGQLASEINQVRPEWPGKVATVPKPML